MIHKNSSRTFHLLLSFSLLLSGCFKSLSDKDIRTITTFNEINFEQLGSENTLVLFDVDETLIQPKDTYPINEHSQQGINFRKSLQANYPQVNNWDEITGIFLQEVERPLIEPIIIDKINQLKNRHITVLALTRINTGNYWPYNRLEEWRYHHLKTLGFEGDYSDKIFDISGFKKHPVFFKGIIATDGEDKGKTLGAVFDILKIKPQEIIMFDDSLEFLHEIQRECKKGNIIFKGYHYLGAKQKEWNPKLIEFQTNYLINFKHWLDDETALKQMHNISN